MCFVNFGGFVCCRFCGVWGSARLCFLLVDRFEGLGRGGLTGTVSMFVVRFTWVWIKGVCGYGFSLVLFWFCFAWGVLRFLSVCLKLWVCLPV